MYIVVPSLRLEAVLVKNGAIPNHPLRVRQQANTGKNLPLDTVPVAEACLSITIKYMQATHHGADS